MVLFRLYRRPFLKFFASVYPITLVLALVWGESLNYYYWRLFWNIPRSSSLDSLGILIVADPQLVGFRNENHMIGPLTRWDCDRFISKGFSHAVSATNPDLIVFLGDLFDEGVEASDSELEWTLSRFENIFSSEIPKIYISGDNDVGGEEIPVQSHLSTRFHRIFSNSFPLSSQLFSHLTFTEVKLMNGEVDEISKSSAFPNLNVVLSHVPFAFTSNPDSAKIIERLEPDLILSAHDHKAYTHRLYRNNGVLVNSTDLTGVFEIQEVVVDGKDMIIEIQSTTCSYRMGVYDVGYGYLRIETAPNVRKFRVSFSILWLCSRFYALSIYAVLVIFGIVVLFVTLIFHFVMRQFVYTSFLKS